MTTGWARLRKMVAKNLGLMYDGLRRTSDRRSVLFGPILGSTIWTALIMSEFGSSGIPINNAAIRPHRVFTALTLEDWEEVCTPTEAGRRTDRAALLARQVQIGMT